MAYTDSPLRYPGGKSALRRLVGAVIARNRLRLCDYAEPFAGGGGLALRLMYDGYVNRIHLNDLDPAIWAFWHSAIKHTDELIDLVLNRPITIDEWHQQREILLSGDVSDPVALGFAAFFLNRTNRSGIIKSGGVIGGLAQNGRYKMDCRFNREQLAARIKRISIYRDRIRLTNLDAIEFLKRFEASQKPKSIICIDPPYFGKGATLYANFYREGDHRALADQIASLQNPWLLTYDNVNEIRSLYSSFRQYRLDLNYSAQQKRIGTELLVFSDNLEIPFEREHLSVVRG